VQIQFNFAQTDASDALEAFTREQLDSAIGRFGDRITRIEVHLSDSNGQHKSGPHDKHCTLEARPKGMDPLAVEASNEDFQPAIRDAVGKLRRALTTRFEKAGHH
jgi:ribosomal subunit interface protein